MCVAGGRWVGMRWWGRRPVPCRYLCSATQPLWARNPPPRTVPTLRPGRYPLGLLGRGPTKLLGVLWGEGVNVTSGPRTDPDPIPNGPRGVPDVHHLPHFRRTTHPHWGHSVGSSPSPPSPGPAGPPVNPGADSLPRTLLGSVCTLSLPVSEDRSHWGTDRHGGSSGLDETGGPGSRPGDGRPSTRVAGVDKTDSTCDP